MMKLEDWYELVLWDIDIPIPPEFESLISKFRAVEDCNFSVREIVYITAIEPKYARALQRQYMKTMPAKKNEMRSGDLLIYP